MKKISLSQPFSATFLVLALLFMGVFLAPFASADWYNPFSWGTEGIVEKNDGRWIEIFNDNQDFYSVIPNNSKHDADIYLCSKTATKKNDLKDLDFATSFNKEQKDMQTKEKLKLIEYDESICYYYKPQTDEKYLKFGEHSTHFIYTTESITAYEDTAFFNDEYVEIGKLSLSTEGYNYKNGKPNIQIGFGDNLLTHTFYIENYSTNSITNLRTIDLNNNGEEIERNTNLKFLSYVEVEEDTYETICPENFNPLTQSCENIINGTKWVSKEQWNEMILATEGENYIIGVFADVENNDYVDIDFDYYGISVLESPIDWATWTADLNMNLVYYAKLNNDDLRDYVNGYNGTNTGSTNASGIIESARLFDANGEKVTVSDGDNLDFGTGAFTINFWIKTIETGEGILGKQKTSASYDGWHLTLEGTGKPNVYIANSGSALFTGNTAINNNVWHMITLVREANNNVILYVNATSVGTGTSSADLTNTYPLTLGDVSIWVGLVQTLDEIGIWKGRALSSAEITQLWNGGVGMTYTDATDTSPQITLTSPSNNSNLSSSLQDFVGVVTDNFYVQNVSLKIDGVIVETDISHTNGTYTFDVITITEGRHNWSILAYDNASQSTQSAIWFYNYTEPPISIDLLSPVNASVSQLPLVNVSCYAYKNTGVTQLNLSINGVVANTVTNSTPNQNLTNQYINNFTEGVYIWGCSAKNLLGSFISANKTFNVTFPIPFIEFLTPPTLVNESNISQDYIPMKVNVSSINFLNVSYSLININGTSYTQVYTNETYDINFTNMQDAHYHYYATICTIQGKCNVTEERHINHDTTLPNITINSGSGTQNYSKVGLNHTINITITDSGLHTCWYNYNSTNTTFSCTTGVLRSIPLTLYQAINSVTFYANDSSGNSNLTLVNWNYKIFEITDYYVASTVSGAISLFNLTSNSSEQITVAYLNYNGTNYLASINSPTNPFVMSKSRIAPAVTSSTNIPFYWNLTTSSGFSVLTSSKNQTVKEAAIINTTCTGMYYLYNLSVVDEITQRGLNGTAQNTSIKIDLNLYTSDKTLNLLNYYTESSKINPTSLCISNNLSDGEIYSIDIQIQYQASDYSTEFYNIEDRTLNSASLNSTITLYDLPTTNAQKFRLLVRDTAYLPRESALVQIERKYLENGTFYISEIPKTDAKGITSASLEVDDVIYNFYIYEDGVLVDSFTNVLAICQTPLVSTCEIDFNSFQTGIDIPAYEEGDDFSYTLGFNSTSRVISASFSIPSGEPSAVELVVIREDTLGTAVCSDTVTSSSGILSCIVPSSFGNSTVLAKLYKNGVEQARGNIKLDQRSSGIYGVILVFLSLMVIMTLIGLAISDNPVISAVFLFVGVVLLYGMNLVQNTGFVGATATILFLAIAIILVIVKAGRRN